MPSSVVRYFHYNPDTQILRVTFVSGMIYDYLEVPATVYEEMKASSSKGIFLNTEIKGKYAFEKVN